MDPASRDSSTCLELALEGERLCKGGDFAGGIAFFEAAIKVGTSDMRTLSAIYSQLGNAYFYLNNYEKALNFHQLDLAIAKSVSASCSCFPSSGHACRTQLLLTRGKRFSVEANGKWFSGRFLLTRQVCACDAGK